MARTSHALGFALAAALVHGGAVGCNTTAMLHPPIVYSNLPPADDRQIILETLARFEWRVESEEPGAIVARYDKGRHVARVRLSYGNGGIHIGYVDSQDLGCVASEVAGCSSINKAYNRWVNNLYREIDVRVAARR
jgi:hypothetical protein